jgi:pimeloyl-ACP methyl ester carboxylesterase
MERVVQTADGRTLAVQESGDPAGRPVLVHNGTPNSRHVYRKVADDAAARGLRLISYDRPGYGGSSPAPGRSTADCAADVRAICAALGVDRVATWGISGGGPHVLACAALLPDLVVAAASLASLAPYGADGLDWYAGMGQENADDFRLYFADQDAARRKLAEDRAEALAATPDDAAKGLETLLTPTDAAVLTGELAEYLVWSTKEGLAPGDEGWWEDTVTQASPWGFELAEISVPVLLMQGREDMFVPFGHGEWLARHIPGVDARLLDHDGHLTLLEYHTGEMHSWLSSHF